MKNMKANQNYLRGLTNVGLNAFRSAALIMLACLLPFSQAFAQETKTVTGKIVDTSGVGIPSASIIIKGTTQGTTSNVDGNFSISAKSTDILIFSAINYVPQEMRVSAINGPLNLTLENTQQKLDEVVVIGYGTQRKESVTGSVVSISGTTMREVPSTNVSQALQGRLAGVDIAQTSTRPGAVMQIRIRGQRSLSGDNNPLIVLDGIPFMGSLNDINPNDIKSIDVLKDASATAIYGARGANGVILITTEKGTKNKKPIIKYDSFTGVQNVFAKYPMMNSEQFIALRAARGQFVNGPDESDEYNTDWQDLFYQTGFITDQNISVVGGSENTSYNFGIGYHLNQGVVPTQQFKRYTLRGSIDQSLGKYVRVGFTSNSNFNLTEGNQVGLYGVLSMSPISTPFNPDGSAKRFNRMAADDAFIWTKNVVDSFQSNDLWLNETRGFATYNALYGEVKAPFLDGLKYRVNLGLNYIQTNNGNYTGQGVGSPNPATISSAAVDNRTTYHWVLENILTYDKTFADKHTINALALFSSEQNTYNRSNMIGQDIPVDAFRWYNIGQANGQIQVLPGNQDYQQWGLLSAMGRIMYSYDNRYMIAATLRSDGSSRLAKGNEWFTYPAVSVGWNIANEKFMQNVNLFNSLKLRAGYGITSNQAIAPYATLGRLDTRPYNFGSTFSTGYFVSQLPNNNLGWEFSKTWNIGLEFSMLKNRLSGAIELYDTRTEDILLGLGLPPTSGVSGYTANIGSTQNKGIEITLNGTIIDNPNGFSWDAGLNFFANRNELTSLASGQTRDEANWWFVGHNINAIFDYRRIGLWQADDKYLNILEPGGSVGMIKVQYNGDFRDDGTPVRAIGPADREVMDVDPKWQGGFNTTARYKGFDLGVVGFYRHGGILFSTIHGSNGYLNMLTGRRNNIAVDYWTPENTGAKYPNPAGPISNDNPKYGSTLSYFDGSFMKIRTITLGYDFNRSVIKSSNVRLRAYFTAQNPFVMFSEFHRESGLDPESNSFGNENAAVNLSGNLRRLLTVGFNTPSTRNYIVGFNLTF
jgi:TonB-dependent starch-binding outer membrane protein SusC